MASIVHTVQAPYPTPSFSRNDTTSSIGARYMPPGELNSCQPSQSVASTPTETPPPSRGHQQQMSFNMGNYGPVNGIHVQQAPQYPNGTFQQHQQQLYVPEQKPQIYTAAYSGVSVYEMEVNGVAVMRRRADSWLNATQILKVAGIDKGKRTKVLEKEILAGEHEKVQGGYGRYQGTWINYQRGREFCRQYGVEELLRALLDYDMGQDGVTLPGQGGADTPTKEQAMAAHRKKMMFNGGAENRPHAQSPNGTFFKNISATAANAVNAIHKARFDSPGPRPGSGNKRPPPPRRQSLMGSQESNYPGSSQQSMHSEGSFGINGQLEPAFGGHTTPYFTNPQRSNQDAQEPPRKRARPSSSQDPFSQGTNGGYDVSMRSMTPTEPNDSFLYQPVSHSHPVVYDAVTGVQPLPQPSTPATIEKQSALISLFLDQSQTDFSNHEAFKRVSGEDLDIPMDGTAHTALHWAATLGRVPLLRALISKGASIYRVNGGGETALIRAAITTNNLDQGTFPELLELLGPTIEMRDGRGRTVLHHIAVSSAVKGRSPACRYYLESLLEFVVRQGSAPNSQQNSFNGAIDSTPQPKPRPIGLARFMSEIVNAVDMSGDTALNLAARIGNKSIIQQLLEVGANPTIPNRGGLKPVDFGVGGDPETSDARPSSQMSLPGHERTTTNRVSDSSRDLMSSMTTLLSDAETSFRAELQCKQALIDQTHTKLRETSSLLTDERRHLDDLHQSSTRRKELKQQITNLRRAITEQKTLLARSGIPTITRLDVKVGDADAGLEVDPSQLPSPPPSSSSSSSPSSSQRLQLSRPHHGYLATLPRTEILQARVNAYRANNSGLEELASLLQARSSELEKKLRRVVSLCTDVAEERLDGMVGSLVVAVESEEGEEVEVGRVREFLRKVEGGSGG